MPHGEQGVVCHHWGRGGARTTGPRGLGGPGGLGAPEHAVRQPDPPLTRDPWALRAEKHLLALGDSSMSQPTLSAFAKWLFRSQDCAKCDAKVAFAARDWD